MGKLAVKNKKQVKPRYMNSTIRASLQAIVLLDLVDDIKRLLEKKYLDKMSESEKNNIIESVYDLILNADLSELEALVDEM